MPKRTRLSKKAGIERGIRLIRATDMYAKLNPIYTSGSVEDVVAKLIVRGQRLDAITVDYHHPTNDTDIVGEAEKSLTSCQIRYVFKGFR